jgi:hypothetical protein
MKGFDNGILIAKFGMCPPCKLMEYNQLDPLVAPSHFMRCTAAEVRGGATPTRSCVSPPLSVGSNDTEQGVFLSHFSLIYLVIFTVQYTQS